MKSPLEKIRKRINRGAMKRVLHRVINKPKYHIDSPVKSLVSKETVIISGWYLPATNKKVKGVRVVNNGRATKLEYGIKRQDVYDQFPNINDSLNSGFYQELPFSDGELTVEVDTGKGHDVIHKINLTYSSEPLVDMIINDNLSQRDAEHQNILSSRKQYYYEKASNGTYVRDQSDPRIVAHYLPQFHPIPENDEVWGKGFTEWRNVTSATARFVGHQQPILPQDLGFYDLRLESVIKDQINLAKRYGIYGFNFYYYWFSGKKVLEKPLESFLRHKDWDFNFSICWANENWTKRWDGRDDEIILAQEYSKDDPMKFIMDVEEVLLDPRYIREGDKPVLSVYRPSSLREPKRYVKVWRDYFKKKHGIELHLVAVLGFDTTNPKDYGFDAALDFAPLSTLFKKSSFEGGEFPFIDVDSKLLDINYQGLIADYRKVALNAHEMYPFFDFPTYKSVMPSWDNDARRKGNKSMVFHGSNPELYSHWLEEILKIETTRESSPLVFINAWNEWAEGTVMEPSMHLGHAILGRTSEVLSRYSQNPENSKNFPLYRLAERSSKTSIAVVVHVFYREEWQYIEKRLKNLRNEKYDLFVTITPGSDKLIREIRKNHPKVRIITVPNRGRDVLPFVFLARRLSMLGYDKLLKLHTKKSLHREDGGAWFKQVVDSLLPDAGVSKVVESLDEHTGIIGPKHHYVSLDRYMGGNETHLRNILSSLYGDEGVERLQTDKAEFGFFAGTMFWATMDAIRPILDMYLGPDDFESERGQIDGTIAHALERAMTVIPIYEDARLLEVDEKGMIKPIDNPERNYPYAP